MKKKLVILLVVSLLSLAELNACGITVSWGISGSISDGNSTISGETNGSVTIEGAGN